MNCEIKRAIFSFQSYKAPRLDGFHPIFFQRFWNIIGHSITSPINDIFLARKIPPDLNTTLICLIPKVSKPKTIHQFHPIGLCNTIYKTITKILFQRLKPHLDDLMHPFQASFIPRRKASDNVIFAQELIHTMSISKSKHGLMALKIDLEKAFDRLEWGFIKHILSFFNFPTNWIELIMSCISSSSLPVLVNGERLNYFLPSRGIRQGNPLSPYIFILCMEYLARLILCKVVAHSWSGIRISKDGPTFSHLFFADDLILFAKATK